MLKPILCVLVPLAVHKANKSWGACLLIKRHDKTGRVTWKVSVSNGKISGLWDLFKLCFWMVNRKSAIFLFRCWYAKKFDWESLSCLGLPPNIFWILHLMCLTRNTKLLFMLFLILVPQFLHMLCYCISLALIIL